MVIFGEKDKIDKKDKKDKEEERKISEVNQSQCCFQVCFHC